MGVSKPERAYVNNIISDYAKFYAIAIEILEQKAHCQQDPDQDEGDEAPEDQAESDSLLIAAAGDLVSSFASALGPRFDFAPFFPLISKYYVRNSSLLLAIAY